MPDSVGGPLFAHLLTFTSGNKALVVVTAIVVIISPGLGGTVPIRGFDMLTLAVEFCLGTAVAVCLPWMIMPHTLASVALCHLLPKLPRGSPETQCFPSCPFLAHPLKLRLTQYLIQSQ